MAYISSMNTLRPLILSLLLALPLVSLMAEGQGEVPKDYEKTWDLQANTVLHLKGPFNVEVRWAEATKVTAVGPQGLVEQLAVSDWLETTSLALERGVGAGIDEGNLKVVLEIPFPEEILLGDRVNVLWEEPLARDDLVLQIRDRSRLEGPLAVQKLLAITTWQSKVVFTGKVEEIDLTIKDQSEVDLNSLEVGQGLMNVYDSGVLTLDPAGTWTGEVGELGMVKAFGEKPEAVILSPTGVWLSNGF